jgi:hypothetical protein
MKARVFAISLAIIILGIILILPVSVSAEDSFITFTTPEKSIPLEKVTIYAENFTTNPMWKTNNPSRYYWDPKTGMYHYFVQPGTGGYTFVPVDYSDESFTLEYDFYPIQTDNEMTFQFGMGSSEMDITRGINVLSKFTNKKNGKLIWIQAITQNNHLAEASSAHDSYGGPTINFEDGQIYHVSIRYSKALMNVDMKVTYKNNQTTLWGYYANLGQELHTMNRLMISSVGMYGNIESAAEGYIDNVDLYTMRISPPPVSVVEPEPTIPCPSQPPTAKPTPVPQSPEPTKSPGSTVFFILALGIISIYRSIRGYGKQDTPKP